MEYLREEKDQLKRYRCGVHQLVAGFIPSDAISNYTLELQSILKARGWESDIFSLPQNIDIDGRVYCRDYQKYDCKNSKDVMIFHFSIGSELTEYFKALPLRKILVYHNITPAKYFKVLNKEKFRVLSKGRDELKSLVDKVDLALGVSEYNRSELLSLGFKKTGVLNLILNEGFFRGEFNKGLIKKYNDNFTNFISVGRVTPNKKLEDIIKIFYYYKNTINSHSRLFLIGPVVGESAYVECLRGLAAVLSLTDVFFTRHLNIVDLRTYYKLADIYITMSEHEGFCIPLLESMYFKVPIIAYGSSAIPEILGSSGVLVGEKNYPRIAELISLVLGDNHLKNKIIKAQERRLQDFKREKTADKLIEYLKHLGA